MRKVSSFPLLLKAEFDEACEDLCRTFRHHVDLQIDWLSVDLMQQNDAKYLKIVKPLVVSAPDERVDNVEFDGDEFEEDDEEILTRLPTLKVTVEYHIVLSPSYQVPVLYFNIKDPSYRSPPTMDTLYRHLIPPHFKAQAENVGVIGGITVTDHPITNSPAFFIHPCQTAAVLDASIANQDLSPLKYLTLWIGAMGNCVGLNIPSTLAQNI